MGEGAKAKKETGALVYQWTSSLEGLLVDGSSHRVREPKNAEEGFANNARCVKGSRPSPPLAHLAPRRLIVVFPCVAVPVLACPPFSGAHALREGSTKEEREEKKKRGRGGRVRWPTKGGKGGRGEARTIRHGGCIRGEGGERASLSLSRPSTRGERRHHRPCTSLPTSCPGRRTPDGSAAPRPRSPAPRT